MKKAYVLIWVIMLCLSHMTLAQEQQAQSLDADEQSLIKPDAERLPWTVGMDLLRLINQNSLPATTLFVKRMTQANNNTPGALRLRVGLSFDITNSFVDSQFSSSNDGNEFMIFVRPGYEFQKTYNKHVILYGADLQIGYSYSKFDGINTESQVNRIATTNAITVGPVGFIGYQYFITDRFSFSTEASLEILYNRENVVNNERSNPEDQFFTYTYTNHIWTYQIRPLYVLNLHFHF